jgi:hypothetical protein
MLLVDVLDELRVTGATIPERLVEYLSGVADCSGHREEADYLHSEYLRELFGVRGKQSLLQSLDQQEWGYVSKDLRRRRETLISTSDEASNETSRPKDDVDPYKALHWRVIQDVESGAHAHYLAFVNELIDSRHDADHQRLVDALGLAAVASPQSVTDVKRCVDTAFDRGNRLYGFRPQWSGRSALVYAHAVNSRLEIALCLEELPRALRQESDMRVAIRLVHKGTRKLTGVAQEEPLFSFPMAYVVPGAYIYDFVRRDRDIVVAIAFYACLAELVAPAFDKVLEAA